MAVDEYGNYRANTFAESQAGVTHYTPESMAQATVNDYNYGTGMLSPNAIYNPSNPQNYYNPASPYYQGKGLYYGSSSSGSSKTTPWDIAYLKWLKTWFYLILETFLTIFTGKQGSKDKSAPTILRRIGLLLISPFTFTGNLLKTVCGLPFALIWLVMRPIAFALNILIKTFLFLIKIVFLIGAIGLMGYAISYGIGQEKTYEDKVGNFIFKPIIQFTIFLDKKFK